MQRRRRGRRQLSGIDASSERRMRDAEIRGLQWERIDLSKAVLTVGASKIEAGEGRTIPLNSLLLGVIVEHANWYRNRFGHLQPDWYVFPFGKPSPSDPTQMLKHYSHIRLEAKRQAL